MPNITGFCLPHHAFSSLQQFYFFAPLFSGNGAHTIIKHMPNYPGLL